MTQTLDDFKIKFGGQTIRVRVMSENETISSNSLQASPYPMRTKQEILDDPAAVEMLKWLKFYPSKCVGERCGGVHQERIYVEVLSKFFTPVSTEMVTVDLSN